MMYIRGIVIAIPDVAYNGTWSVFKGIPYAKAKRFHAPEPLEAWEGELDATSFGYMCPLLEMQSQQV